MASVPDLAEEQHVNRCTREMRGWYDALKIFMLGLGNDTDVHPRQQYVGFWRTGVARSPRVFAYVNFRPSWNQLVIDVIRPQGEVPSEPGLLSEHPGQKKGTVLRIRVDSADDVARAKSFIAQSYRDA